MTASSRDEAGVNRNPLLDRAEHHCRVVPPKASDVDSTQRNGTSRAWFATTSISHSGSVSVD